MRNIEDTLIFNLVVICLFLFVLIWLFVIHSPIEIASIIKGFNSSLQWSKKLVGLYAIYLIEFYIIILFWSLVLSSINKVVKTIYTELTVRFIRKKRILIKLIRFYYGFNKIYHYLEKGTFRTRYRYYRADYNLIHYLTAPTLTERIKSFSLFPFLFFKSIGSILAVALTIFTLYYSYILDGIETINHQWYNLFFSLWNNVFPKLSAFVVFILIIFLWYFVSSYGVTKRAIAQANKKQLEEVVKLFRELEKPVIDIVIEGSKNLEYALNCYDSIYEFWTLKKFNTLPTEYQKLFTSLGIGDYDDDYLFSDITALNDLIKILKVMNNSENRMFALWFANYRFELIEFRSITSRSVNELEYYERLLFTKKGFDKMPDVKYYQHFMKIDEESIRKELANNQERLNMYIIKGLELIYAFNRYIEAIHKILHMDSDKIGRVIRQLTGKE
ncbi:hypothetical protein [Metabacillus elymi]|uniref:Phage abortive infection protein n=1 Tax=Metabacillus elymi TaxID=2745198 RepID=A0ABX6S7D6_9BACI|nr:hypothetical protein [Metabacillus sp. KUDC1714]QNF30014.1 hypothetical protein HUW50_22545 [Metabacillus sp. KUDC1714]